VDIRYFISQRLRVIRYLYETASLPFVNNTRKIDAGEPPYDQPPLNFDPTNGEPQFMDEWQLNQDALTLLGHSGIAMLQVTLQLYLDAFKSQVEERYGRVKWKTGKRRSRGDNWFARYKSDFVETLGIDWDDFGGGLAVLEQIALARDDVFHRPDLWSLDAYQSTVHFQKYSESFVANERFIERFRETGKPFPGDTWPIDVTPDKMDKCIDLVSAFCDFMEQQWVAFVREVKRQSRAELESDQSATPSASSPGS
jgi:hypothetical protein